MSTTTQRGGADVLVTTESARGEIFLLASTINTMGVIDLPAVFDGKLHPELRAEFSFGSAGELIQRCYGKAVPRPAAGGAPPAVGRRSELDMLFLAECILYALGPLTPPLFQVITASPQAGRRLLFPGSLYDRRRTRLLHDAFSLYLLAYEERLV